jgi:PAS domain S-box-containing protein
MAMHDRSTNWDDLPNEIVVDCQSVKMTPNMLANVSTLPDDSSKKPTELKIQHTPYLAGAMNLFDFRRRNVGRMVLFENVAPQHAAMQSLIVKLGVFFFITAAVALWGAKACLNYFEKRFNQSHQQALQALESQNQAQSLHGEEMLQYRKAIECATDAIAIVGLDRRLRYVNPAFEKLFGYAKEEANTLGGTKNLYYDQQNGVKAFQAVSQGKTFAGEMEMVTRDNRKVHVFLRAHPLINDEGKMFGIVAIYTDLSEKKSIERELLVQTKALVECNRAFVEAKEVIVSFADGKAD